MKLKKRQKKTIYEKFSSNSKYENKDSLIKLSIELNKRVKPYIVKMRKHDMWSQIDTMKMILDNDIPYCGKFFLRAYEYDKTLDKIFRGGDAYVFNDDDEFNKIVKLNTGPFNKPEDETKWQEYYVIAVSNNGWSLIWYNYCKGDGYDYIIRKGNDIILEGNIGKIV